MGQTKYMYSDNDVNAYVRYDKKTLELSISEGFLAPIRSFILNLKRPIGKGTVTPILAGLYDPLFELFKSFSESSNFLSATNAQVALVKLIEQNEKQIGQHNQKIPFPDFPKMSHVVTYHSPFTPKLVAELHVPTRKERNQNDYGTRLVLINQEEDISLHLSYASQGGDLLIPSCIYHAKSLATLLEIPQPMGTIQITQSIINLVDQLPER